MTDGLVANGTDSPDGGARPVLFSDVDRALVMAAMADKLRVAGVPVPLTATVRATEALAEMGPMALDDLYWVTRLSLVNDRAELAIFNRLFDAVFDTDHRDRDRSRMRANSAGAPRPGDRLHTVRLATDGEAVDGGGLPWATRPNVSADDDVGAEDGDRGDELTISQRIAAPGLVDDAKPFDLLDERELARVGELVERSMTAWPHRRSRRRTLSARGDRVQLRTGLRRALRTGGEPLMLPRTAPVRRPRPVVAFLDLSGSMESFARAYLHVARPLAVRGRAEVFAFATDATRITASLRARSPVEAIDRATEDVGDRFAGTRLATSLRNVLGHRSWNSLIRGAVVLIVSDGWDTDPPDELDRHMARLDRMTEKIVWVNPRLAADDFEPAVGGMATALPYCDHFLPGHSLAAMERVLVALESDRTCAVGHAPMMAGSVPRFSTEP